MTLVLSLATQLKSREWKLVSAESCTGGGLAYYLTQIPGSSTWFDRGFITYSNAAKEDMLGVKSHTLQTEGAVSEKTAKEMAEGALERSQAQISVAITGIAGPTGGSTDKPVGTVWFGFASIETPPHAYQQILTGDRQAIREQAIEWALKKLLEMSRNS